MIGSKHMLKISAAILPFREPSIARIQGLYESDCVGVVSLGGVRVRRDAKGRTSIRYFAH